MVLVPPLIHYTHVHVLPSAGTVDTTSLKISMDTAWTAIKNAVIVGDFQFTINVNGNVTTYLHSSVIY